MVLPINKPSNNLPSFEEETPIVKPEKPRSLLHLPDELLDEVEEDTVVAPAGGSYKGRSLGEEEETLEEAVAARRAKIGLAEQPNRGLQAQTDFRISNVLSSDDLIYNPWETYEYLMPKVVEVKTWLQDVLSDQDKTTDIAEARSQRGAKYNEMRTLIDTLLVKYFAQERVIQGRDGGILMTLIANEMLGLGPIEPLWLDPRITEIMVNGPERIRVEIKGKLVDVPGARFRDADHLLDVCQQILAPINRVIDVSHPTEDGRLSDGSRVNIVHPVVAPGGPYLTIRRFPEDTFTLKKLVDFGSMSEELAVEVANLIAAGCSTVVSGGTGTGKTSTLNALSGCIPPGERIITIEDNLELQLHPDRDVSALEARKGTGENQMKGAVTIRDLVRNSLRMRPDRIIVGEVRDKAAYDMLQAMSTGHDGSMTTVHANDAHGAIERLVNLITESGEIDANRSLSLIAGGVDVIVTIERYEDGSRRCSGVYEIPNRVTTTDGVSDLEPIPLFEFVQDGLTEDEMIYGHYQWMNDPSPSMVRKHRLNKRKRLTLEEIYTMSEQHGTL